MSEFLGIVPRNVTKSHPKLIELYLYVGEVAPFGTLVSVDPSLVTAHLQGRSQFATAKQSEKVLGHFTKEQSTNGFGFIQIVSTV